MTPTSQLDIFDAIRQRDLGLERVMPAADRVYRYGLHEALEDLACSGEAFCSDDIRRLAGDPPGDCSPNIAGAVVMSALKRGLIKHIGWTRSRRLVGHGNRVGLYVGAGSR